jgi:predicted polyphosphate/ATP-dependent NAD kinase
LGERVDRGTIVRMNVTGLFSSEDQRSGFVHNIGLVVNPIAGMGGSVGLKGTDGEMVRRARDMGALPVTPERTAAFLGALEGCEELRWYVAPARMGEDYVSGRGNDYRVVGDLGAGSTTAEDTQRLAQQMVDAGIDLLVFVGGDGTARDIHDAVGARVAVVGVPAGVKVYSGAFALSPRAAAEMVRMFCEGTDVTEAEVLDIDEAAFREDRLDAHHYGYLLVPKVQTGLQPGKTGSPNTLDTAENKQEIAATFLERMDADTLYLLGPGTTVAGIAEAAGVSKTLLGIDALKNGEIVGSDLNERQILGLLEAHARRQIVVTPLGGNGFIFGRGNKPFTPAVIRRVGVKQIVVLATEQKAREVSVLRVDTGDAEVDRMLSGYVEVIIGYDLARMMKVQAV